MLTFNTRNELVEFLYGANSTSPDTLVGVARIGGELLNEAVENDLYIYNFFPCGDEGESIAVDIEGNILSDYLYY